MLPAIVKSGTRAEDGAGSAVRWMLLALVLFGAAGLLAELLLLLEHYDSVWQWVLLVLIGGALISGLTSPRETSCSRSALTMPRRTRSSPAGRTPTC